MLRSAAMRFGKQSVAVGVGVLVSLATSACAETTCEDTRTCEKGSGTGGVGAGGTTWTGGSGGAGGSGGTVQPGSFGISVESTSLSLTEAGSFELVVTITRNAMTDPITLDFLGLPTGVTTTPVTAQNGFATAKIVLQAGPKLQHGPKNVTLSAKAGADEHTLGISLSLRGAPGSIDNGFAVQGEVNVNLASEWARAYSAAVAPDGKIYVVGDFGTTAGGVHAYHVLRYDADGKVDQAFGTNGVVMRYTTPSTGQHVARSVFLDAQARPVVGGYFSGDQLLVARYDTNGALDTSFATTGEVVGPGGSLYAITAHGTKIVGAGKDDKTPAHALVGQMDAAGVPDSTFGAASFAVIDTGTSTSEAVAIAIDSDNKVVVAGNTNKAGTPVLVARLTPGGQPDSFGTSGIAYLDPTNGTATTSMVVRPNKRIVVGGGAAGDKSFVMQLDPQGALDTSFGTGGRVLGSNGRVDALALDGTGRLVTAGRTGTALQLGRLNVDGSSDATFGSAGSSKLTDKIIPYGITLLPDGRALVVGVSQTSPPDRIYLTRIWM